LREQAQDLMITFGGADDYILYLNLYIFKKPPFWGPILTGPAENRVV